MAWKKNHDGSPWDERYIYLHEWLSCMVNVGKYASPMDAMAYVDFRSSRNCGGGIPPCITGVLAVAGPPWQTWFPSVLWPWPSKDDPSGTLIPRVEKEHPLQRQVVFEQWIRERCALF